MLEMYDFTPKRMYERVGILGLLTVLILFGTHSGIFSLTAFAISALVVVFDKSHFKLMMMTYLMLMAHVFCISPDGMSYFTFLMFLYVGINLAEERSILWIAVFFILYVVIVQLLRSQFNYKEDLKLIGNVLFIGHSLSEIHSFNEDERKRVSITFIVAVLVSSYMRSFDSSFFRISAFTESLNEEGYGAGVERIVRFSGLYQDPNYYSVNLIAALCLIVILHYKGNTSKLFCVASAGVILYYGSLTYSKSFLLMLLLPLAAFLYANHRIGRYDVQVISILMIVAAIVLVLLINPDYLTRMLRRVESKDSITTGRSELWLLYLDGTYQKPDILLFGSGIGSKLLFDHAPHNSYVDLLYHLGVCGSSLLIAVIVSSGIRYSNNVRKNFLNFSVLLSIAFTYFFLSQLHSYEFPVHLMLSYMVLNQWDLSNQSDLNGNYACQPLVPDLRDNHIKTLISLEERE